MSKLNRIYKKLDILSDEKENNVLKNLTRIPKRESAENTPHFHNEEPFYSQQADTLYLPDDRGYKYLLVVVDIATRICDGVPMKTKSASEYKDAFIKIYKRKILKKPEIMTVDSGTEFQGVCKKWFETNNIVCGAL